MATPVCDLTGGGVEPCIYHEPQAAALCGVHALNALVQAPTFTAGQLADLAAELDEQVCYTNWRGVCGGVLVLVIVGRS